MILLPIDERRFLFVYSKWHPSCIVVPKNTSNRSPIVSALSVSIMVETCTFSKSVKLSSPL